MRAIIASRQDAKMQECLGALQVFATQHGCNYGQMNYLLLGRGVIIKGGSTFHKRAAL